MPRIWLSRYEAALKPDWDAFVAGGKNGLFLFQRDYVDYHADRFPDHSLMFHDDRGRLVAVLPATVGDGVFSSHAGLTFGGVVSDANMNVVLMLAVFEAALRHVREQGIAKVVYKAMPHIYHRLPAEEDLYALFRHGARLYRRDVSAAIDLREPRPSNRRRSAAKLADKHGLEVRRSHDFQTFMAISEQVLKTKFGATPVHTTAEIALLAERFPENVKLFAAYRGDDMLGGVIVYESARVAHTQYIGVSEEGKRISALDVIVDYLIGLYSESKAYLDFGTSNEDDGRRLNEGLIDNKESFGGRAVVHDFYELA
jgi:hypothetical protein